MREQWARQNEGKATKCILFRQSGLILVSICPIHVNLRSFLYFQISIVLKKKSFSDESTICHWITSVLKLIKKSLSTDMTLWYLSLNPNKWRHTSAAWRDRTRLFVQNAWRNNWMHVILMCCRTHGQAVQDPQTLPDYLHLLKPTFKCLSVYLHLEGINRRTSVCFTFWKWTAYPRNATELLFWNACTGL